MTLPIAAAERKAIPITTGFLDYFPDATVEVAILSRIGNEQHNPGQPLHWAKEKSTDHANCIVRHLLERGTIDTDGVRHSAKVAWRAMALLQIEIEKSRAVETPKVPFDGHYIEVVQAPGESMSEAICRTSLESHAKMVGLPKMQEQG